MVWFDRAKQAFRRLFLPMRKRPLAYLEIGVWEGNSLCWMLENVLLHSESRAVGIDPYLAMPKHNQREMEQIFRVARRKLRGWRNLQLFRERSSDWLLANTGQRFDIIYIDGDHHEPNVYEDARLSWPLLKAGGVLLFDDYYTNRLHDRGPVAAAVSRFHSEHAESLRQVWLGWQIGYKKLRSDGDGRT